MLERMQVTNGYPPKDALLFVAASLCSQVLQWGHLSKLQWCGGLSASLKCFWWPSLEQDIEVFITPCPVCAENETSYQHPPPMLRWSISHLLTWNLSQDCLPLKGTLNLFFKMPHFFLLPKVPSVKEKVESLHVLLQDVVSDQCPQFASQFWEEFCRMIRAVASLSYVFHSQSNLQTESCQVNI